MKFRQRLKKLKRTKSIEEKVAKMQKQNLLLDGALKKLVELNIAVIDEDAYVYSQSFERTAQSIREHPPGKLAQIKYGKAGKKLLPQIFAMAASRPSRRDIENLLTGYVMLDIHAKDLQLDIDQNIMPDLAYAVWYLNDHKPTVQEVEEWNSA